MRERDDVPRIVIEREKGGNLGSFLLGALLGAGVALLLAPRSGAETQEKLKEQAKKLKGVAERQVRDAQKSIEERLDVAREDVRSRIESIRDAVEQGRVAAREERGHLKMKLERSKAARRPEESPAAESTGDGGEPEARVAE